MRKTTIFLLLPVLFLAIPLFSAGNIPKQKISIAIAKIKTINCDENIGYVTEIPFSKASDYWKLYHDGQDPDDRIAQKPALLTLTSRIIWSLPNWVGFSRSNKSSSETITRHNGFAFDIRSVDSMNSSIDTVVTDDIDNESEIESATSRITEKIHRYYMGYGKIDGFFELTANFGALVPFGSYANHLGIAYGGSISATSTTWEPIARCITFLGGAYRYIPKDKRYKTFDQFPFATGFFYKFNPQQNIVLRRQLDLGMITIESQLWRWRSEENGVYQYEKRTYQNFCVLFRLESSLYIYDRWMLTLSPGYVYIFDKTKPGFFLWLMLA